MSQETSSPTPRFVHGTAVRLIATDEIGKAGWVCFVDVLDVILGEGPTWYWVRISNPNSKANDHMWMLDDELEAVS